MRKSIHKPSSYGRLLSMRSSKIASSYLSSQGRWQITWERRPLGDLWALRTVGASVAAALRTSRSRAKPFWQSNFVVLAKHGKSPNYPPYVSIPMANQPFCITCLRSIQVTFVSSLIQDQFWCWLPGSKRFAAPSGWYLPQLPAVPNTKSMMTRRLCWDMLTSLAEPVFS